jgi:hypothetical protein
MDPKEDAPTTYVLTHATATLSDGSTTTEVSQAQIEAGIVVTIDRATTYEQTLTNVTLKATRTESTQSVTIPTQQVQVIVKEEEAGEVDVWLLPAYEYASLKNRAKWYSNLDLDSQDSLAEAEHPDVALSASETAKGSRYYSIGAMVAYQLYTRLHDALVSTGNSTDAA